MTRDEKIKKLSKRSGVSRRLIRELPEERLSHYFNQSSGINSRPVMLISSFATLTCASSAMINFASGNPILAGVMVLLMGVNATAAIKNQSGIVKNRNVKANVEQEIVTMKREQEQERREAQQRAKPINGPT